ncbi:hypothetical protein [Streptomyces acidiscabies]|uniref:Uncharacterized protein n=1 Tax=Streptomyces acidiscabies TaxID=42234 RepID=A0ABU4LWK5_9ACTN|nr:hypothetical protein [Streptomyces acidiscabies]MDX3019881.1 hypothetical protein [Streptomyces acidiscabies]
MDRIHQPHPQPTPSRRVIATGYVRRAPLPPAALDAINRLERALAPRPITADAYHLPATKGDAVERSVRSAFPIIAAFLDAEDEDR